MADRKLQNILVLDHLRSQGPITPKDALEKYGVFRLAARVYDLRKQGHPIHCRRVLAETGNHYGEYFLRAA